MVFDLVKKVARISALGAVAAILLVAPTTLARAPERVATVEHESGLITWSPLVDNASLVLTVSGPADFYRQEQFSGGTLPSFGLFDNAGFPLADGLYKYELKVIPQVDPATRSKMQAARESGDESAIQQLRQTGKLPAQALVQAGSFSILDGAFVAPDLGEPGGAGLQERQRPQLSNRVVLTNGDGVIRNSLCVGFDCPDAPLFDDSTILLMENNTRIKFGDTSNSPFPNNDWEIEANSSLSGGANYLGFNDCGTADNDGGCATDLVFAVEAGARQSALYVESDGDIGIGTSNPVVDVHVVTGNTPTLRLDQDGSSGFAPQVWDVAGNETNFFVRDVTGGSRLPLRIRPAAPTSSIDVAASGNVGLGTAAPTSSVHVRRTDGTAKLFVEEASGTESARTVMQLTNNGRVRWQMTDASANGQTWTFFSSEDNFNIASDSVAGQEFVLTGTGNLTITGTLTTGGPTCGGGCDQLFRLADQIESIDEHAELMWKNSYLPGVGPTAEGQPMNLSEKTGGMLNELEKAHVYIEQLHRRLEDKEALVSELVERVKRLESQQAVKE